MKSTHWLMPRPAPSLDGWTAGDMDMTMRWKLFNWLLDVSAPDTMDFPDSALLLAFSLVDHYLWLERGRVTKDRLHVLGMSALLIGGKMFAAEIPDVDDFLVYLDDPQYTQDDVVISEKSIFQVCGFAIFMSTRKVLDRQWLSDGSTGVMQQYLENICLLDFRMHPHSWDQQRKAIQVLVLALSTPVGPATIPVDKTDALVSLLDAVKDEKCRVQSGKRGAIQRKFTHQHEHWLEIEKLLSCNIVLVVDGDERPAKKLARQCRAETLQGTRCKLRVSAAASSQDCYCWKHVKLSVK